MKSTSSSSCRRNNDNNRNSNNSAVLSITIDREVDLFRLEPDKVAHVHGDLEDRPHDKICGGQHDQENEKEDAAFHLVDVLFTNNGAVGTGLGEKETPFAFAKQTYFYLDKETCVAQPKSYFCLTDARQKYVSFLTVCEMISLALKDGK